MTSLIVACAAFVISPAFAQQDATAPAPKSKIESRAFGLTPIEPANTDGAKAPPPRTAPQSAAARLRELDKLRKDGVITQEEFDAKKKEILKSM